MMSTFALLIAAHLVVLGSSTVLDLTIKFSNASLSTEFFNWKGETRVFGLNVYSCQEEVNTQNCPGGQATFDDEYWIRTTDWIGPDTWRKTFDLGDTFTGPIVFGLFAPLLYDIVGTDFVFYSSVTACKDDPADYEMSLEICDQHGMPWTFEITDPTSVVEMTVYPSFGLAEVGETTILLEQFYSPQLNNSRDIAVYLPPSLIQNTVRRPINIMFLFDGSEGTVVSYSTATGFEAAQVKGVIPESIMVGISTISFAYDFDFSQRTYELTYETAQDDDTETCISGNKTGGTPLLLEWLDENVIPAVLAAIGEEGMDRGEVSATGGSLGGLTSCYAAAARSDVFKRAVCSAPSNCFNAGLGGLSRVITDTFASTGVRPLTVIQFFGAEVYMDDDNQLGYMVQEDEAWVSIGLEHLSNDVVNHPVDASTGVNYAYATLAPAPDSVVMSYVFPSGQHAPSTWEKEFAAALPNLYRASPPENFANRVPKAELMQYISAPSTYSSSSNDEDDDTEENLRTGVIVLVVILVVVGSLLGVSICYITKLRAKLNEVGEKAKLSSSTL
jgi:hypothetical protein